MSVRQSVRPYVHKKFFRFQLNLVCRYRDWWWWLMHVGVQYDPIQGQGHEPLKVGNSVIFKCYLLPNLQRGLANDHAFLNYGTIPKAYLGPIFDIRPSFRVMWLWSWQKRHLWGVDRQSRTGLIFLVWYWSRNVIVWSSYTVVSFLPTLHSGCSLRWIRTDLAILVVKILARCYSAVSTSPLGEDSSTNRLQIGHPCQQKCLPCDLADEHHLTLNSGDELRLR